MTRSENVLCIVDGEENMELITLIAAEYKGKRAEVAVVLMEPRKHHHEPPRSVDRAMKEADVVVTMTFGNLMHKKDRKEACTAGVKFATLGGATKEYWWRNPLRSTLRRGGS